MEGRRGEEEVEAIDGALWRVELEVRDKGSIKIQFNIIRRLSKVQVFVLVLGAEVLKYFRKGRTRNTMIDGVSILLSFSLSFPLSSSLLLLLVDWPTTTPCSARHARLRVHLRSGSI